MTLYTIIFFLLCLLLVSITKLYRIDGIPKWMMPTAFSLKVLVGLYFLFIYTEYYGNGSLSADAGNFMDESEILNNVIYKSPGDYFKFMVGLDDKALIHEHLSETRHWDVGWQSLINDNKNILRIHSLIHFFSFANPIIHVIIMCLLALLGIKNFMIGLRKHVRLSATAQFLIFLLLPSALFWTSSILKEPLLFLGMGILARGLLARESTGKTIGFTCLGIILLIGFKPYVLGTLILPLFFYLVYKYVPKLKLLSGLVVVSGIIFLGLICFPEEREKAVHLMTRKQQDFTNIAKGGLYAVDGKQYYYFEPEQLSQLIIKDDSVTIKKEITTVHVDVGGLAPPHPMRLTNQGKKYPIMFMGEKSNGYIQIPQIDDSFSQLLANIPMAVVNCLFRPFLLDPGGWLKYPAMFEVLALFAFLIFAFIKRRSLNIQDRGIVIALIVFIILLSTLIGLTTPVIGAIVRYRMPVYIALAIIGMIIMTPQQKFLK